MSSRSVAQQFAQAAWVAPLVAFGFNLFSRNIPDRGPMTSVVIACMGMLLYIAGVVCAVVALAKKSPNEPSVTGPAIAGLVLSLVCIVIVGSVFISALLRAGG